MSNISNINLIIRIYFKHLTKVYLHKLGKNIIDNNVIFEK